MSIGRNLCDFRQELNLNQRQVAEKLGLSVSTYANWEQGRREPSIKDIISLCELFKCSPNDLFDINTDESSRSSDIIFLKVATNVYHNGNDDIEYKYEEKNRVALLKIELNALSLSKDDIFAFRVSDNSMKPWYIKDDIVLCVKSNHLVADQDNIVTYDYDNKAKIRYTSVEQGMPWVDLSSYNYITNEHLINKMTTRIEDAKHCKFFGYVVKLIRNHTQTVDFLINR